MLQCLGKMSREGELSQCDVDEGGKGVGEDDDDGEGDDIDKDGREPGGLLPVREDLVIWEI